MVSTCRSSVTNKWSYLTGRPAPTGLVGDRKWTIRSLHTDALEVHWMILEPPVERIGEAVARLWSDERRVASHRGLPAGWVRVVHVGAVRIDAEEHRPIVFGEPIGTDTVKELAGITHRSRVGGGQMPGARLTIDEREEIALGLATVTQFRGHRRPAGAADLDGVEGGRPQRRARLLPGEPGTARDRPASAAAQAPAAGRASVAGCRGRQAAEQEALAGADREPAAPRASG
jgi:hypothetical protein